MVPAKYPLLTRSIVVSFTLLASYLNVYRHALQFLPVINTSNENFRCADLELDLFDLLSDALQQQCSYKRLLAI